MDHCGEGFYRLGVELAQGAEGDVFAAVSATGGSYAQVAAKRVRVTAACHRRHIQNEIATALLCRKEGGHTNVIRHLDWFPGFDGPEREIYLITERCDFGLDDLIRTVKETRVTYERCQREHGLSVTCTAYRFAEAEISKLLEEMVLALDFLNSLGVVHQDVKAENILWKHTGNMHGSYKICDFGVVGFAETTEGRLCVLPSKGRPGTLWTQAPEVLRSKARNASCDIWSLGCVLFEVSFLEKPFNSIELMAYSNDTTAALPDPFPPVRSRKETLPTNSPPQKPTRSQSVNGFSPKGKARIVQQRWVYSSALKSLISLCLMVTPGSRPTPKMLQETKEYAATFSVTGTPWKASMTSTKFYRALLTHYKDRSGSAVFALLYEDEDSDGG